jgi:hypothetical protein
MNEILEVIKRSKFFIFNTEDSEGTGNTERKYLYIWYTGVFNINMAI